MKLLILSHLYPHRASHTSGIFVHHQATTLATRAQVQLVAPTPWWPLPWGIWGRRSHSPRHEQVGGVDLHRPRFLALPRRLRFHRQWRGYEAAVRRVVDEPPDLIHAHCAYPDGYVAQRLGKLWDCPVYITVHGYDIHELPALNPRWKMLVSEALAGADRVVTVSDELAGGAMELGTSESAVLRLPSGVACDLFAPRTPKQRRVPQILYVGRFQDAKGMSVLLDSLELLKDGKRQFRLRCVGGNALHPATEYEQQARRLGLAGLVRFDDEVPWLQIPQVMAGADLLVLPSFSEGMPLVLLEAMAAGLPVVTTRCGGPSEIVDDAWGELVEPGDVAQLAGALARVLDRLSDYDPVVLQQRARQTYDHRALADRLFDDYEQILAAH